MQFYGILHFTTSSHYVTLAHVGNHVNELDDKLAKEATQDDHAPGYQKEQY